MNRYKKEEKARGEKFPTYRPSKEEFGKMLDYYETTTETERRKEHLVPKLKEMDRRSGELKES